MAIYAYTGVPGSGKSYGAVENQILPMLKQGRRVVTNIPLHLDKIRETISTGELVELPLQRIIAEPDSISEYATPGSVLIIDEAWKIFPTSKADKFPAAFKTLMAEHRHMVDAKRNAMVIVLIVQDLAMISAFVRGLVDSTYMHTKLSALGLDRAYRVDIYSGSVTGQRPPESKKVRSLNGLHSSDIFKLYKSHTMSETEGSGAAEKSGDRRALLWKRPIFMVLPVMVVLLVVFGLPAIHKQFGKKPAPGAAAAAVGSTGHVPTSARVNAGSVRPPAVLQGWRITATLEDDAGHAWVWLQSGERYVKLNSKKWCDKDEEGFLTCIWEGQTLSNQIRYLPDRSRAMSLVSTSVSVPVTPAE